MVSGERLPRRNNNTKAWANNKQGTGEEKGSEWLDCGPSREDSMSEV